jgi:hypothetical protein
LPERNRWAASPNRKFPVSPEASFKAGQIVYAPLLAPTRLQRACEASGELYRIVRPIKHLDEDRNGYDLTRAFIEEALFFPFAPHDDLIDACAHLRHGSGTGAALGTGGMGGAGAPGRLKAFPSSISNANC